MPVCYTEWKVLPHKPIVVHSDRLWTVEGKMENGTLRIMSMARLDDGRVILHNAIALDDEEMARLDAWGTVAGILVPNAFHRMDCRIMQLRYPGAKVYAPAGAAKAVAKATPVHGSFADAPQDSTVRVSHLPGIKDQEGLIEVHEAGGVRLVFNDMIMNMKPMKFPIEWMIGPTGRMAVPRFARWWFASDKPALRKEFARLAELNPVGIVPGHGAIATENVTEQLRAAAALI